MSDLVSQADAARQLGVTRQAINKLVKAGKLPLIDGRVHVESARAVLAQRLNPSMSKILQRESPSPQDSTVGYQPIASVVDYGDAKARREHHEANLAEMREKKLAGDLVERAAVEAAAFRVGRMTRDAVLGVPAKVAPDLANCEDHWEVQQRLTKALRQAIDDVERMAQSDLGAQIAS